MLKQSDLLLKIALYILNNTQQLTLVILENILHNLKITLTPINNPELVHKNSFFYISQSS